MNRSRIVRVSFLALIAAAVAVMPSPALAQAWLAPRGEASFSLGYMNNWVNEHVFDDGVPFDGGRIDTQAVNLNLGYAVTDRFTFNLGLPFVTSRYQGDQPHARNGVVTLDNGHYHGTFQDFRFEARYMAKTGSLVITPFLGVGVPSHGYEYFGHSAVGKDIKEVQAGVSVGRRLDPVLPNAYFQGRYGYAIPEHVLGISHNRSNIDLELGYFVTPALTLRSVGLVQVSHGGFHELRDIATPEDFEHHDQLARTNFFELGFGAAYALTRSLDGYAFWLKTISARNTHMIAGAISIGISVNFSPAQMMRNRKRAPAHSS